MQNIDFHTRKPVKNFQPHFNTQDPEYFTHLASTHHHESERGRKRANRMMSCIIGLCIISFTTGLVIGLKFASGSKTELVDKNTRTMVTDFSKKFSSLIQQNASAQNNETSENSKKMFPRNEYPFVIRIGSQFSKKKAYTIAGYLSSRSHTVILSKTNQHYRIFTGPYKTQKDAELSLKKINAYSNKSWFENACILKR